MKSSVYRYFLDSGSRKFICPGCGKRRFVRYVDSETDQYLPDHFGRCDRESKCGYHFKPEKDQPEPWRQIPKYPKRNFKTMKQTTPPPSVFMPVEILNKTLSSYEKNIFIQNLLSNVPFPLEVPDIEKIISLYRLGTVKNGYMKTGTTFPFIDVAGNIRVIQAKTFDKGNHTVKTGNIHSMLKHYYKQNQKPLPGWLEKYLNQDKYFSCLFGEHLLNRYPGNPVALVEAPKTTIYGALYFGLPGNPENLLWLAVYNKSSFSLERVKVLKGRSVIVFPDLSKDGSTFEEWRGKATDFQKALPGTTFQIYSFLERFAPDAAKAEGYDIADFLIKTDWRRYRQPAPEPKTIKAEQPRKSPQQHTTDRQAIKTPNTEPMITKPKRTRRQYRYSLDDLANGIIRELPAKTK